MDASKTIFLAAALAASLGLGCQGTSSKPSASDPAPAPTAAAPAPSPAAPGAAPGTAPPAPAPSSKAYTADIEKLCDVVRLSNVANDPAAAEDRRLPIANWLAANLTTAESRQFLVRIQPLGGAQKADALEAEARRVGLSGCALAAEWRSPPPSP